LLAQVCHRWREIAVTTFQLWASVDIEAGFPHLRMLGMGVENVIDRALPLPHI
jgi:hypothetical protein